MFFGKQNISVLLLLSTICFASEREVPQNNREIFFRLCDSVMSEMVSAGVIQYQPAALHIETDAYSSYYQQQFIHGLVSRNIPVFVKPDSSTTTLKLSVRESSVVYGEPFSESFFGERRSQRTVGLRVDAMLISTLDGKVITSTQVSRTNIDTVSFSIIDQLNEPAPASTKYQKPKITFFDSLIEPAIVTIASGVVIYLFFTIRS